MTLLHVAKPPHREQMLSDDGFKDNLTTSETDSPSPKFMPAAVRISECVCIFLCVYVIVYQCEIVWVWVMFVST